MNLVSLLILPAIISLRNDDPARFAIAGAVAGRALLLAIAFSKRKGGAFAAESDEVGGALAADGAPEGASAGE